LIRSNPRRRDGANSNDDEKVGVGIQTGKSGHLILTPVFQACGRQSRRVCKQTATVFDFASTSLSTVLTHTMATAVHSPTNAIFEQQYERDEDMEESYVETSQSQEVSDEGWRAIA